MQCRGCGESVDGVEHRMVAEWPFCLPCFEQLMASAEAAKNPQAQAAPPPDAEPQPVAAPAPAPKQAEETKPGARCSLCSGPIVDDDGEPVGLGPWRFCQRCFEALCAPGPEPEQDAPETEAQEADEEPPGENPAMLARQPVSCAGCGRRVPLGGCKPIDEEPYCPECYLARTAD